MDPFAYAAGFIDADGNIGINHQNTSGYVACVGATNANIKPLMVLQDCLGGMIYERKPRNPNHSTTYHLTWTNRADISRVLNKIIPYLVGKQDVAILVKEFVDSRLEAVPSRGQHTGYSEREKELYSQVSQLREKYYKKPKGKI